MDKVEHVEASEASVVNLNRGWGCQFDCSADVNLGHRDAVKGKSHVLSLDSGRRCEYAGRGEC